MRTVDYRPGRSHLTNAELRRHSPRRDPTREENPKFFCSDCNSVLTKTKTALGEPNYVCVLCLAKEARQTRNKAKKEATDYSSLSCTVVDGEVILESPLGTFIVEADCDIAEPAIEDEDLFMPIELRPGSLHKLNAMRARFVRGLPVFHSEDKHVWNANEQTGQAAMVASQREQEELRKEPEFASGVWDLEKEIAAATAVKTEQVGEEA